MMLAIRADKEVLFQLAMKQHLAAVVALQPKVLGHVAPREDRLDRRRDVIGDPVHGSLALLFLVQGI